MHGEKSSMKRKELELALKGACPKIRLEVQKAIMNSTHVRKMILDQMGHGFLYGYKTLFFIRNDYD